MPYKTNKGTDQPAHLCSLISTFVVPCLEYNIYTCCIQSFKTLARFCSWASWFESYPVANPRRHVFVWRESFGVYMVGVILKTTTDNRQIKLQVLQKIQFCFLIFVTILFSGLNKTNRYVVQVLHMILFLSRSMTKPTKWRVCPAKTQISRSESLLGT